MGYKQSRKQFERRMAKEHREQMGTAKPKKKFGGSQAVAGSGRQPSERYKRAGNKGAR